MKRFVTSYSVNGKPFSRTVDAIDLEHAQRICDERRMGETVAGVLYAVVQGCTSGQADKMIRRMAECEMGEPPDASEFDK